MDLFCDRLARADAAKRLLDLGADANAQDITGRTPLHTAVAADAMGVFQVIFLSYRQYDSGLSIVVIHRLCSMLDFGCLIKLKNITHVISDPAAYTRHQFKCQES